MKPSLDTFFPVKLTRNCSTAADLNNIYSYANQSLFAGIQDKQPNVGANTDNIAFHLSFALCSVWWPCLVASFLSVEN